MSLVAKFARATARNTTAPHGGGVQIAWLCCRASFLFKACLLGQTRAIAGDRPIHSAECVILTG